MKLSRVHPFEWLVGLIGLILVAGIVSTVSSPGTLHVVVLLVAAAGAMLPVTVSMSARTNVPIIFETMLWIVSILVSLILLFKAIFPSDVVFGSGWLTLAGMLAMSFALWRSVAREQ